jgi:hypothetical protein
LSSVEDEIILVAERVMMEKCVALISDVSHVTPLSKNYIVYKYYVTTATGIRLLYQIISLLLASV